MVMKSPSERVEVANTLSTSIIDPENTKTHLTSFLICDSYDIRSKIVNTVLLNS